MQSSSDSVQSAAVMAAGVSVHHDADTTAAAHAHTTSPASAAPGPCQPSGSSSAAVPPQAAGYSLRRWQRWATGLFKRERPLGSEPWFNPEADIEQRREWLQQQQRAIAAGGAPGWPEQIFEAFYVVGLAPDMDLKQVAEQLCAFEQQQQQPSRTRPHQASAAAPAGESDSEDDLSSTWQQPHLHPPRLSLPPQVLYHYPTSPDGTPPISGAEVAALAFPSGVAPERLRRSPSLSALDDAVMGRCGPEAPGGAGGSVVFMLKAADNLPLYGCVSYVRELLHRPPSLARPQFPRCHSPFRQCLIAAPRAYVLLSRYPFFELHFKVLKVVLDLERLERLLQYDAEKARDAAAASPVVDDAAAAVQVDALPCSVLEQQQRSMQTAAHAGLLPATAPAAHSHKLYCSECAQVISDMLSLSLSPAASAATAAAADGSQDTAVSAATAADAGRTAGGVVPLVPMTTTSRVCGKLLCTPSSQTDIGDGNAAAVGADADATTPRLNTAAASLGAARSVSDTGCSSSPRHATTRDTRDALPGSGSSWNGSAVLAASGPLHQHGGVSAADDMEPAQHLPEQAQELRAADTDTETVVQEASILQRMWDVWAPRAPSLHSTADGTSTTPSGSGRLTSLLRLPSRPWTAASLAPAEPLPPVAAPMLQQSSALLPVPASSKHGEPLPQSCSEGDLAGTAKSVTLAPGAGARASSGASSFASAVEAPELEPGCCDPAAAAASSTTAATCTVSAGADMCIAAAEEQQLTQTGSQQVLPALHESPSQQLVSAFADIASSAAAFGDVAGTWNAVAHADAVVPCAVGHISSASQPSVPEVSLPPSSCGEKLAGVHEQQQSSTELAAHQGQAQQLQDDEQELPPLLSAAHAVLHVAPSSCGGSAKRSALFDELAMRRSSDMGAALTAAIGQLSQVDSTALLDAYHCSPVPPPGGSYRLLLGDLYCLQHERLLPQYLPPGRLRLQENMLPYAEAEATTALQYWTVAALCRCLSLEHMLLMLTALLLEKQIVVFSPSLPLLCAVVLSALPLLRPYAWHSLLLPVTPSSMLGFLDAPVPFILGVQYKTQRIAARTAGLVCVEVYEDRMSGPVLPALPGGRTLAAALAPHHAVLRAAGEAEGSERPLHLITPDEEEAAAALLDGLHAHLAGLAGDLRLHTIVDVGASQRTGVFMRDSLIDSMPANDKPFMRAFVDTQMFTAYADAVISDYCET